jgi:hypothetical protein
MANGVASTLDLAEVVPGRLMIRTAARQMRGLMAAFMAEFGYPPELAETFRSIETQQHYANTLPAGTFARPGTSNHGWGTAADMWSGISKYGTPQNNWMQGNAPAYGFTNDQGRATKSRTYPNGEAHHWVYVGNPTIVATGEELAEMSALFDALGRIEQKLTWMGEQADRHEQKQIWMGEQADRVEAAINAGFTRLDWLREQQDRVEPKIDTVAAAFDGKK